MNPLLLVAAILSQPQSLEGATRAFFTAFNSRDFAAMEALYAPDAVLTSSDFCAVRGKKDLRRTYQKLFSAHPDVRDIVETTVIQDDRVAIKFSAISLGGPKPLQLQLMTFLRFRNGLIVEDHTIFDNGGASCDP